MARPRSADIPLEDRIEAQTHEWLKVSGIAAKIATFQSEEFLKKVQEGDLSPKDHIDIADVMGRIVNGASTAIQAGSKLLAARKSGVGVVDSATSEEALAEELLGKNG